jgi:hypothetical protein
MEGSNERRAQMIEAYMRAQQRTVLGPQGSMPSPEKVGGAAPRKASGAAKYQSLSPLSLASTASSIHPIRTSGCTGCSALAPARLHPSSLCANRDEATSAGTKPLASPADPQSIARSRDRNGSRRTIADEITCPVISRQAWAWAPGSPPHLGIQDEATALNGPASDSGSQVGLTRH